MVMQGNNAQRPPAAPRAGLCLGLVLPNAQGQDRPAVSSSELRKLHAHPVIDTLSELGESAVIDGKRGEGVLCLGIARLTPGVVEQRAGGAGLPLNGEAGPCLSMSATPSKTA